MSRAFPLAVATSVVSCAAELALPWLAGTAVTHVVSGHDATPAITAVAALVGLRIAAGAVSALALAGYRAGRVAAARDAALADVVATDTSLTTGDVVSRVLLDAGQVGARGPILLGAVLAAFSLVAALVLLAVVHWVFLGALVVTFVLTSVVLRRYLASTGPALARYRTAQAGVTDRLIEAREGAETIRATASWTAETQRILAPLPQLRGAAADLWRAQQSMAWRLGSIELLTQVGTVAVGAWLLARHAIEPGQLATALGYAGLALASLEGVEGLAALNLTKVAAVRLAALRDGPRVDRSRWGSGPVAGFRTRGLVLADGTEVPDLDVPPGAVVAVTGPADLRTLAARTLSGRLAPHAGTVDTDGDPRRVLAGPRVAAVGAHLRELVGLGVGDDDLLRSCCDLAQIGGVVAGLPHGYATPTDQLEASGGEWGRLALAQALARRPGLLVLDDATVGLDLVTERRVAAALRAAAPTVVHCTSRPGVVAQADIVLRLVAPDTSPGDPSPTDDRSRALEPALVAGAVAS